MKSDATIRAQTEVRFKELYHQLNSEQRRAVDTIEGTVMVLAGPGTGKTQLLAMRIANILRETQMDPWNILCLTFTDSGVAAMRERLLSIMGEAAYYVRVHTFHSFCNDIIQEHQELFSLGREWRPLSDIERVELFESLLDDLPGTSPLKIFGQPYAHVRDISGHIQSLKQEHISPRQFRDIVRSLKRFLKAADQSAARFFVLKPGERTDALCADMNKHLVAAAREARLPESVQQPLQRAWQAYETAAATADKRAAGKARTAYKNQVKAYLTRLTRDVKTGEPLGRVYQAYEEQLAARGRYDYEDMINRVIEALAANEELRADYQERFQYILVDEYQDTNGAQNEVVRLLSSFDEQPNICVVGDDKQSIYRFQGASLANMLDFYERYREKVAVITLQDNYRSQPTVLAAADAVITYNQESITHYIPGTTTALVAQRGHAAKPLNIYEAPSTDVEDYFIAQEIAALVAKGVAPREIAVIVRYHRDSQGIFAALRQLKVPVRLEGGEDALLVPEVQQFLTLLECISDVRRDDLLARVVHLAWLALPTIDVLKVVRYAGTQRVSLWLTITEDQHLAAAGVSDPVPWRALVTRIAQWRSAQHNMALHPWLSRVLQESGLIEQALLPTSDPGVLQALRRVFDEAHALNETNRQLSLPEFLGTLRRIEQHQVPLMTRPYQVSDNAVRVMTAHKAKGLEFAHVFLLRVCDKHWGNNPTPARLTLPLGLVRYDMVVGSENNEDERRLFYVAMTRAEEELTFSFARHNAVGRALVPSLFLHEVPAEFVVRQSVAEDWAGSQERLAASLAVMPSTDTPDVAAWVRAQLQHYVMSVTHLNNYLTCPRLFYIRNILQVPSSRTVYQALGTAVHGALSDFLYRYQQDKQRPPADMLVQAFERHVRREVLSSAEMKDVMDVGRDMLAAYFTQYASTFSPNAVSEFDFKNHGVRVGSAAITGKIDKIEWLDDARQTVNVVDYKTGQPDGKAAALAAGGDYHRQLVFYKLLCEGSPRFPFEMVSGEIDFVQPNRRGRFVKKKVIVTDKDEQALRQQIETVWNEIQSLKFLEASSWCGECEYCQL